MKKIILLAFCAITFNGNGQVTFQRWYDHLGTDQGKAVLQTFDGGYALLCQSNVSSVYFNTIMKTDSAGNILWIKRIPTEFSIRSYSFRQTSDSGFVFGGNFYLSPTQGGFIMKIDKSGVVQWSKIYNTAFASYNYTIFSIRETFNGDFITIGAADSINFRYCYRLMKVDGSGNLLWIKDYGPFLKAKISDIEICGEEGYVITGTSVSDDEATVIKTDLSGNMIWAKAYGVSTDTYVRGYRVIQSPDNGFVIMGYDFDGRNKIFLLKITNSGSVVWARKLWINEWSVASDFKKTSDSGFVICATAWNQTNSGSYIYVIKFDSNGTIQWSRIYGDNLEEGYSVSQIADGGFLLAGLTNGFSSINSNIYVAKTDINGSSNCFENNVATKDSNITSFITTTNLTGLVSWPTIVIDSSVNLNNYSVLDQIICTSVGIEEKPGYEEIISSFPNPVADELIISSSMYEDKAVFTIYNTAGEQVYSQQSETSNRKPVTVDVSTLTPGIYFVKVKTEKGTITAKFVKE